MNDVEGILLGNRYEILEKIGGGGMAIVYKARCQLLNRYVAVKVLRDEFVNDEEFIKKFRRESQAAASLSHPNIVGIYDVGEEEIEGKKIYYIVMEYIKGKTLKELIKSKDKLSVDEMLHYSIQIGEALEHAHRNHIVHRDIKPHNIMITEDDRVKVTDFGIARAATTSTVTNTSNVIGSVHYFSPEQARGGYTDERSDIYSLGIVMYEMLTGILPYDGETPVTVALKHIQDDMKSIRDVNPDIPESIDKIILKCTEKSPDDRYQKAGDLIEDLMAVRKDIGHIVNRKSEENIDSPTQVIPIVKPSNDIAHGEAMDSTAEINMPDDINETPKENKNTKKNKPKKTKKKKAGGGKVIILAILLAFLTTTILGVGYIKLKESLSVREVDVPPLVGLTEEEAEAKLKDLGLNMKVVDRVYSKEYEEGKVVSQDIKDGEKVKEGYTIEVEVSKGLNHVKVPTLINRNIKDIDDILGEYGLKSSVKYQYSDEVARDLIISQNPDPYSEVEEGTIITVVVSQGPENKLVTVPNLIGMKENDAKNAIVSSNLVLGGKNEKHSDQHPKGTVIWQSVDGGREVEKNTTINITVSLGSNENTHKEEPDDNNKEIPFNLNLTIPDSDEDIDIAIVRYQNNSKDTVYTGKIAQGQTSVVISLKGTKNSKFEVYFNGSYHDTINHPDR